MKKQLQLKKLEEDVFNFISLSKQPQKLREIVQNVDRSKEEEIMQIVNDFINEEKIIQIKDTFRLPYTELKQVEEKKQK